MEGRPEMGTLLAGHVMVRAVGVDGLVGLGDGGGNGGGVLWGSGDVVGLEMEGGDGGGLECAAVCG